MAGARRSSERSYGFVTLNAPFRRPKSAPKTLSSLTSASTALPTSQPLLLTVDETAVLLRTTRKAIYALIERRQIPGIVRLGRRVLVRSDELLDWLRQKSEAHR
jgi:excisionase family DNA binding protein